MRRFYFRRTVWVTGAFFIFWLAVIFFLLIRNASINLYRGFYGSDDAVSDIFTQEEFLPCDEGEDGEYKQTLADAPSAYLGNLTILMYHNVLKKDKKQSVYCINENSLRKDFEYLRQNGYTVIDFKTLERYVESGKSLPEKAVILTFDDGYLNNVRYALPLLREYGYTALFSVVGSYTLLNSDNPKVGGDFIYLDWDEIAEISYDRHIEIGLHSYDLHELKPRLGVAKLKNESDEEYVEMFAEDTDRLMSALKREGVKSGYERIYAYPYGKYNALSEKVLKEKGIKITLTCNEGINRIKAYQDLYLLKRLNRDATKASLGDILGPYKDRIL